MTQVHISTKYAIDPNDVDLLPQNKRTWWLRDTINNTFVNAFPKLPCTEAFNISIDLPDSEYTAGTGDYNTVNADGKHISQRITFYVQNGQLHYCKKNELPSVTGGASPLSSYNPFGASTEAVETPKEKHNLIEGNLFCANDNKFVTGDYNCVVGYVNDESIGMEECSTCIHSRKLFYSDTH